MTRFEFKGYKRPLDAHRSQVRFQNAARSNRRGPPAVYTPYVSNFFDIIYSPLHVL
jgi:hypothetical protein